MNRIEDILTPKEAGFVTIRSHRPGDIGYVIHRHGVIYAREYGFNTEFDAYVAGGMADFIDNKPLGNIFGLQSAGIVLQGPWLLCATMPIRPN